MVAALSPNRQQHSLHLPGVNNQEINKHQRLTTVKSSSDLIMMLELSLR
jgi:hypothetical protein